MSKKLIKDLEVFAAQIRLETMKEIGELGFGHLSGSLSIADLLSVLYGKIMKYDPKDPEWEDRDKLVLSKGHAGPALYSALALKDFFPMEWLKTLNKPGTSLPSHCDRKLTPGVDMTTGSLGQGVSTAIGLALADQLDNKNNFTYLVVGDGECNEGQVWEGAMFSAQHKLDNMIWFVDYNKKQLDGYMSDVVDIAPIAEKFAAFNFHVQDIDGHDVSKILDTIEKCHEIKGQPHCIILNTTKGKGLPELEAQLLNHNSKMQSDFIERSIKFLEEKFELIREDR